MKELTKKESQNIIEDYFKKDNLDPNSTKKIKKLAMTYRIRLGEYRKRFCKKCYSDLKLGKTRINKMYKQVSCLKCNAVNRWKIKLS